MMKMMNKTQRDLHGLHIMLSASLPKELEESRRAQDLFDLMVVLIGEILSSHGTLVFGGHPTVTPLIHRIANSANDSRTPHIKLFQLSRYQEQAPEEVNDARVFSEVTWVGAERDDLESLDSDLKNMRDLMVEASQAAIFIGGKTVAFAGRRPGIIDEYERFTKWHPRGPVYLIGMLGGASLEIIRSLESRDQPEPNSLNESELRVLHHSDNIDLVSSLVLADIQRAVNKG